MSDLFVLDSNTTAFALHKRVVSDSSAYVDAAIPCRQATLTCLRQVFRDSSICPLCPRYSRRWDISFRKAFTPG